MVGCKYPKSGTECSAVMEISVHEYVLAQLERWKYRWPRVAEGSGVPLRTIQKVAQRTTKNPRIDTVEKLAKYFREQDALFQAGSKTD